MRPSGKSKRETRGKTVDPTPKGFSKAQFYKECFKKTDVQVKEQKEEPQDKDEKETEQTNIEEKP